MLKVKNANMEKCELFSKKKRKEKDEISSIAANNKGTDRYTQMNVVMNYVTVV
jgi:hypothetical protein